jgi:hypothetical protein
MKAFADVFVVLQPVVEGGYWCPTVRVAVMWRRVAVGRVQGRCVQG